jgi:hypothetical protein
MRYIDRSIEGEGRKTRERDREIEREERRDR